MITRFLYLTIVSAVTLFIIFSSSLLFIRNEEIGQKVITDAKELGSSFPAITPTSVPETTVLLTGDVMLGRTVMTASLDINDYVYPFRKVASVLNEADVTFVNLENPIIENCPRHEDGFKFCADPLLVEGLIFSGIDVVTLANNHTLNYGNSGLSETVAVLETNSIKAVGMGNLAVMNVEGLKLGFLGFDLVSAPAKEKYLSLISRSAEVVDVLIIGVHWGSEYKAVAGSYQRDWAHKFINAGAKVVVGHHPHWVQDVECFVLDPDTRIFEVIKSITAQELINNEVCPVGSEPVFYSLGNFIFDQMWSEETKKGLAIRLTFTGTDLIKQENLQIYMPFRGQPEFQVR